MNKKVLFAGTIEWQHFQLQLLACFVALPIRCGLPINNKQEFTPHKISQLVTRASNKINDFASNIKSVWNESVALNPQELRSIQNRHEDFLEMPMVIAGFFVLALILVIGILVCKWRQCDCPKKNSKNPSHNDLTEEDSMISPSKDQLYNGSTEMRMVSP